MAKVGLRAYRREISQLLEHGANAEAIAHCRQVLRHFPKDLDSYRLLGKAYLESGRHDEATDIFERIVRAAPDDFVAHVGLSIIADERGDLGSAIWHMQRAFEAQPSNPAIQSELQRLYGRRDGAEPPKIRMTRGALARMYMQGELYEQAIAELRAVLAQEPQRTDLKVLLAHACFRAGLNAEAADRCAELLRGYPYSFDANRIMIGIFPPEQGNESREIYRRRVIELDPYSAFSTESLMRSDGVPDAQVQLERLDDARAVDVNQKWIPPGALGVVEEYAAAREADRGAAPPPTIQAEPAEGEPQITAGQEQSLREDLAAAQAEPSADEAETAAAGLVPAELPAWLRDKMPTAEPTWEEESELPPTAGAGAGADDRGSAWGVLRPGMDADRSDEREPAAGHAAEGDMPAWLRDLGAQRVESYADAAAPDASHGQASQSGLEPAAAASLTEGGDGRRSPAEDDTDVLGWLGAIGEGTDATAHLAGTDEVADASPAQGQGETSPVAAEGPAERTSGLATPEAASTVDWFRSLEAGGTDLGPEPVEEPEETEQLFTTPEAQEWTWPEPAQPEPGTAEPASPSPPGSTERFVDSRLAQPTERDEGTAEPPAQAAEEPEDQETPAPELADWLAGLDAAPAAEERLPGNPPETWTADEPEPSVAAPTSASDWRPAASSLGRALPEEVPAAPSEGKPVQASNVSRPADQAALDEAHRALERGEVAAALEMYAVLIRKGRLLEETLQDLREMVYRYPVDVGLWQTLGDAYMRANRLQEALDAYNKAEELIR